MRVQHDSLSILCVLSELKSATIQTNLFTKSANLLLIELSEEVELEDALSYLRSRHKVDLKELSLQVTFVDKVTFEGLK